MNPRVLSATRIPYDILTSIIDELALDNQFEDLSACAQTCRILLHPCRVHLFSTVTIARNAPQFAAALDRNPSIQVYIRELTYRPVILSKDIANALLLLSNVKTLVLQCRTNCQWETLPPYMQHALAHLFSSSSVTRIMVYNFISLPAILLSSCSNLKHLDMNHFASFTSEACNTTVLAPPKLVSLNVAKASRSTVELLLTERGADGLPFLDLSDLRSLTIRMMHGPVDERRLVQILRSTPKLEHLCFTVLRTGLISASFFQALTLSLPTLRSLGLNWTSAEDGISRIFTTFIETLQALAHHPNDINELNLTLRMYWSHHLAAQGWERVDQILADRSAFRRLEKLSIKFQAIPDEEQNKTLTVKKFPWLAMTISTSNLHPFSDNNPPWRTWVNIS